MTIKITTTKAKAEHVRLLIYGESGIGKTRLISTAPDPLIVSAEKKTLSLRNFSIPFLPITSYAEAIEEMKALAGEKGKPYKTICIDSITHIAEIFLHECKRETNDGRKAYGDLQDKVFEFLDLTSKIPKHIYMIAKILRQENEFTNLTTWCPAMPGKSLTRDLPYFFDLFFPLKEAARENGSTWKYLQTEPDLQYSAKGDSSCLEPIEQAHLTNLFNKILEGKKNA